MVVYNIISTFNFTDCLVLIACSFLAYVFQFYYKYFTRPNKLPGPLPLPIIECGYLFTGNTRELLESLHKKYGDICEYYLAGSRRILISRPEYVERILASSSKDTTFLTRFPYSEGLEELGTAGKGIIVNHDVKSWKFNRQFFNQVIFTPNFNNEAVKWINILTQELEVYWKSLANLKLSNGNLQSVKNEWQLEIDMKKWARRFTTDMIIILATGERSYSMASYYNVHSPEKITLSNALIEDSEKFIQGITDHHFGFTYFIYFNSFLRHYMPFLRSKIRYLLKNRDNLFKTLDLIIKERRKVIEEMPIGAELRPDMLTSLIVTNTERDLNNVKLARDDFSRPMTDAEIRGNLLDALVGGIDETANTFSFLVYYVCQSPQVKQKMIDEIDSVFPPNTSFHLKYEDLLKLKYCDAIINEIGRIMPVPNEIRRYLENPSEIAGYQWEAGTMIHIYINGIHSNKNHWPNPEIFDPDRFYKESANSKMNDKARHKYSLVTFGGGLRTCPGRKLARIELLSLMVVVFGKYDVDLVDINAPLNTKSGSITICGELPVKIRPRKLQL
ncbi:cytochrome P450 [Gigaspora rosea]|uniref:Cytochrome P450 n=1 Tax=Gigaspora rosea TaxID=44941 RepID=A0A397V232_9GLOM|nr:cytochrome P450 [Gigaspora rosea]